MSQPETLKIDDVEYVRKDSITQLELSNVCVIRTRNAGVHVGIVVKRDAIELELKNSRRIWRWQGANCLSQLAIEGCDTSCEYTRISIMLPSNKLTSSDVCEVINMAEDAAKKIMEAPVWKA